MKKVISLAILAFFVIAGTSCNSNSQKTDSINNTCYANIQAKKIEADNIMSQLDRSYKNNKDNKKSSMSNIDQTVLLFDKLAQIGHPVGIKYKCSIAEDSRAPFFMRQRNLAYCVAATKVVKDLKKRLPAKLQNDLDQFEKDPKYKADIKNAISNMCTIK